MPRNPTRHCTHCLGTGIEELPPELLATYQRLQKGPVTSHEYCEELDHTIGVTGCSNRLSELWRCGLADRHPRTIEHGREYVYTLRKESDA